MKIIRLKCCCLRPFFKAAPIRSKLHIGALLLAASALHAQEIKIYTGANLVMNGNVFLVVNNAAFKNDGSFAAGTGTVMFTGNTDTTIGYVSGASYTRFNNLTLDKSAFGIAIKSPAGVKSVLTVTTGYLYADSNLTLLSDVTNTARLAAVPASGAVILGKAMVERYIPSKRAWRLMTAPVTNGNPVLTNPSTIYNSWQNKGVYVPGRGLLVSDPGMGPGIDKENFTSLKTWNVSSQLLQPVTNTIVNISPGNNGSADNIGYFVFIRGDRDPMNFIIPNTNITTLTSIGSLQTGAQTFNASSIKDNFTLIGNPYASPIDFNLLSRTNLDKRFYVWDPSINYLGAYVTLDDLDGDGTYTPVPTSVQTKEIQSSQAFFVITTANGAASLTINESAKSVTNNLNVFKTNGTSNTLGVSASLSANLYLLNSDSSTLLADGTLVEFGGAFDEKITRDDAVKFVNVSENFGMARYGTTMAIERRPPITGTDTLFFNLSQTTKRQYQLRLTPQNIDQPDLLAFFEDGYLQTSTPLNLASPSNINFAIDENTVSSVANRFRIVFRSGVILPVSFYTLKAYPFNENIKLEWRVPDQVNVASYDVESSVDGLNFKYAYTAAKNSGSNQYSWIDQAPVEGVNFYRIKINDNSGAFKYSSIVKVLMNGRTTRFAVVPNPVKSNTIQLQYKNKPAGQYQFNLFNGLGQVVFSTTAEISRESTSKILKTPMHLPAGVYQLQVTGPANKIESLKLIFDE